MLETASRLMQSGVTPSVNEVSEEAGVSRATAYRYFPSQAALVQAVVNEGLGPILEWESSFEGAEDRIASLFDFSLPRIEAFEATFRAALKLSLEQWADRQAGNLDKKEEFVRGHRIQLLEAAIEPLRDVLKKEEFERLLASLSLIFGIESILVLKDINGLKTERAHEIIAWAAQALVRQAIIGESQETASTDGA